MKTLAFSLFIAATFGFCSAYAVSDLEWASYKSAFAKVYPSVLAESSARCNYAFSKLTIESHNIRAAEGLETYTLGMNQFSDLNFFDYANLFPPTPDVVSMSASDFPMPVADEAESFSYASFGFTSPVVNQGIACNSGWAYATATALKIFDDVSKGVWSSGSLSAQMLIDCAGAADSCRNQVSQAAFDYLAIYKQKLHRVSDYPNRPLADQRMCLAQNLPGNGTPLATYARLPNGMDDGLKAVVTFMAPVVVKFNPGTFEFMHYRTGVFTQPPPIQNASHYMTVVGYGTDRVTSKRYWLLQNSFDVSWGEAGFIRIEMDAAKPIANEAVFPLY